MSAYVADARSAVLSKRKASCAFRFLAAMRCSDPTAVVVASGISQAGCSRLQGRRVSVQRRGKPMVVGTAHSGTKEALSADQGRGSLVESRNCWDLGREASWAVADVHDNHNTTFLRVAADLHQSVSAPMAGREVRQVEPVCRCKTVRAGRAPTQSWTLTDAG